jgi:hypothetical protein
MCPDGCLRRGLGLGVRLEPNLKSWWKRLLWTHQDEVLKARETFKQRG